MNKSKVLLVLFLLPMALGTTSLINNMSSGTREFSSLSELPDSIQRVLSDSFENSNEQGRRISVDGDNTKETLLNLSFNYSKEEDTGVFDAPSGEAFTIKIEAVTEGDIEVEHDGKSVKCDCDSTHTIELELPENLLELATTCDIPEEEEEEEASEDNGGGGTAGTQASIFNAKDQSMGENLSKLDRSLASNENCVEEFRSGLRDFFRRSKNNIISRIKETRLAQHERNVEEKDCDNKDDEEDKIECFINAASELPRSAEDEREEIFSKIEDHMEDLNYSDEDDKKIFLEMLDELNEVRPRGSSDLRRKLRRHRDTREFVDNEREDLNEINARIVEAKEQLELAETEFNNSNKTPFDFGRYQQQTQRYHNEHMYLTMQLSRQKDHLRNESLGMIRDYQFNERIFNQADANIATRYATTGYNFPHHQTSVSTSSRRGSARRVNLGNILQNSPSYWGVGSPQTSPGIVPQRVNRSVPGSLNRSNRSSRRSGRSR